MMERLQRAGFVAFPLRNVLLILTGVHLVALGSVILVSLARAEGITLADQTTPVGGDFVNLWTTGVMVSTGRMTEVYDPDAFMAFQWEQAGTSTGFRLWAYPPHSLPLTWPFGQIPYPMGWFIWGLVGVAALWWGARRIGLGRGAALCLVLSPAALHCGYLGQSGNLMAGLLMVALAGRNRVDLPSILAATALSLKPQLGLLIPLAWGSERRWLRIALTGGAITVAILLVTLGTGIDPWRDYLSLTLPALAWLQRESIGPFLYMIPSVFMSARILLGDAGPALIAHMAFALPLLGLLALRITRSPSARHRRALVLLGTALLLPYIHSYDLAIVLAGALLALPDEEKGGMPMRALVESPWVERVILMAWALPYVTLLGNMAEYPLGPPVMLLVLLVTDRAIQNQER